MLKHDLGVRLNNVGDGGLALSEDFLLIYRIAHRPRLFLLRVGNPELRMFAQRIQLADFRRSVRSHPNRIVVVVILNLRKEMVLVLLGFLLLASEII